MKTNNKRRANDWEREAARVLSRIISGGKSGKHFWRTNSSGTVPIPAKGDIHALTPEAVSAIKMFDQIEAKWFKEFDPLNPAQMRAWGRQYPQTLMLIKGKLGRVYLMYPTALRSHVWKYSRPSHYIVIDELTLHRVENEGVSESGTESETEEHGAGEHSTEYAMAM